MPYTNIALYININVMCQEMWQDKTEDIALLEKASYQYTDRLLQYSSIFTKHMAEFCNFFNSLISKFQMSFSVRYKMTLWLITQLLS